MQGRTPTGAQDMTRGTTAEQHASVLVGRFRAGPSGLTGYVWGRRSPKVPHRKRLYPMAAEPRRPPSGRGCRRLPQALSPQGGGERGSSADGRGGEFVSRGRRPCELLGYGSPGSSLCGQRALQTDGGSAPERPYGSSAPGPLPCRSPSLGPAVSVAEAGTAETVLRHGLRWLPPHPAKHKRRRVPSGGPPNPALQPHSESSYIFFRRG